MGHWRNLRPAWLLASLLVSGRISLKTGFTVFARGPGKSLIGGRLGARSSFRARICWVLHRSSKQALLEHHHSPSPLGAGRREYSSFTDMTEMPAINWSLSLGDSASNLLF